MALAQETTPAEVIELPLLAAMFLSHWEWEFRVITATVKGLNRLWRKKFSSCKLMSSRGGPEPYQQAPPHLLEAGSLRCIFITCMTLISLIPSC